jgi:hypothetical protein
VDNWKRRLKNRQDGQEKVGSADRCWWLWFGKSRRPEDWEWAWAVNW